MAADDVGRIRVGTDLLAVVIDTPSNPGNLGTLVRSCDALGAHGVIVTGHAADIYDPATITASRGPCSPCQSSASGLRPRWHAGLKMYDGR